MAISCIGSSENHGTFPPGAVIVYKNKKHTWPILDGERVSPNLIDPHTCKYIGMFHPASNPVPRNVIFFSCPVCDGDSDSLTSESHQHYIDGHLDIPQYVSLDV